MRKIMVFSLLLMTISAAATDVYRWRDKDGNLHLSDQWRPGAEKIRIEEASVYSSQKPAAKPARPSTQSPASAADAAARYESVAIASPAQEEVLWNIDGQLRVSVQVTPSLQPGHGLRLYMDGERQEMAPGSTQIQLTEVYRGVHTLKADVVNESGTVLISSPPTSFAVKQTSVANPNNPQAPRPPVPTPRPRP